MPQVEFTNRDLLRSTIVEPAWYRVRIETVGEAPAKQSEKGPSTNYPIEGTVLFNGDNGDTKYAGVPIDWNFNSKAMGFAVGFLKAFGVEPQAGVKIELKSAEGRELDVFIENDTWQNRPKNQINHKYRMPKPEVHAAA